jgi:DNA-binding transcriptional LysR family regulator
MRHYTLRQIDSLLEFAATGSISAAAERLHLTQPAVSVQLRQLEEAVGVQLLTQVGRRLQLTEAGEALVGHATRIRAQLERMEDAMAAFRGLRRGRLRLGCVTTAKYFVPMLLTHFRGLYPGIEIALSIENRDTILGQLERWEIDLAIMGRAPEDQPCVAHPFATNPLSVVAAPDHPLVQASSPQPLSALKDDVWVVRERGSGTRQAMERLFTKHRFKPRIAMELPSNETIKQAAMAGMGIAFLSERTIRHELAGGRLASLAITGLPLVRHWYVVTRADLESSPAADAMQRFLLERGAALIDAWA